MKDTVKKFKKAIESNKTYKGKVAILFEKEDMPEHSTKWELYLFNGFSQD